MKQLLFFFILTLTALSVKAQSIDFAKANMQLFAAQKSYTINTIALKENKKEKRTPEQEIKRAKRLKITGLVFTSLGGAGAITTTAFVAKIAKSKTDGPLSELTKGYSATIVGFIGYLPSAACIVTGIPMTIVGFKKAKKLKEQTPTEF